MICNESKTHQLQKAFTCSKSTMETAEQCVTSPSYFTPFPSVSIVDFEHVIFAGSLVVVFTC